jgi:hypothetical protein
MHSFTRIAPAVMLGLMAACANRVAPAGPSSGTGADAPAQVQLTPANLEELMRRIGPTYKALTAHLEANDTAESAREAQQLAEWFGGVEKFWAQRHRHDAVKWAEQARTYASEAAGAAATGDAVKAGAATGNMAGACKQCHGTYRESDGAGGYRIRGS